MKLWIVPLDSLYQSLYNNSCFQLFPYFPLQSIFWCLSSFHLSARELPTVLIVTISSLGGEDAPLVIVYNCRYDFYLFHYPTAIFWALSKIKPGI